MDGKGRGRSHESCTAEGGGHLLHDPQVLQRAALCICHWVYCHLIPPSPPHLGLRGRQWPNLLFLTSSGRLDTSFSFYIIQASTLCHGPLSTPHMRNSSHGLAGRDSVCLGSDYSSTTAGCVDLMPVPGPVFLSHRLIVSPGNAHGNSIALDASPTRKRLSFLDFDTDVSCMSLLSGFLGIGPSNKQSRYRTTRDAAAMPNSVGFCHLASQGSLLYRTAPGLL